MQRLFFDTSYTRLQAETVGITRTVRRLQAELARAGVELRPVSYAHGRFVEAHGGGEALGRLAEASTAGEMPGQFADAGAARNTRPGATARGDQGLIYKLATSAPGKWAVGQLTYMPWPFMRAVWAAGTASAYGQGCGAPADVRPGDVVLSCDASWNYAVWRAARRVRAAGGRFVPMVHDLMPLRNPEFVAPLVVRLYRGWLREMLRASDAIVCNSAATEADLRAWAREQRLALPPIGHFRLGSDPAPDAIANGSTAAGARDGGRAAASASATASASRSVRAELAQWLGDGMPVFSIVGSIEPKKNHLFALRAFETLWAQGVQARLVVAGRVTREWQAIADVLLAHPERGTHLMLLLDAGDAEIARLYGGSRALVFPSLMEGFGLPLVEARTRGCPVIASDLPVFQELADAGVWLYPRGAEAALVDALRLHAAQDMRPRAGVMPPFTWADSARQCLDVIAALLGRDPARAAASA